MIAFGSKKSPLHLNLHTQPCHTSGQPSFIPFSFTPTFTHPHLPSSPPPRPPSPQPSLSPTLSHSNLPSPPFTPPSLIHLLSPPPPLTPTFPHPHSWSERKWGPHFLSLQPSLIPSLISFIIYLVKYDIQLTTILGTMIKNKE